MDMMAHLHALGVRAPIVPTSTWGSNPLSSLPALTMGDIIDVHGSSPKPSSPVAVFGVYVTVPMGNKGSWAKGDHIHFVVLSVIIGNPFAQNLAAPV